jgi:hypothetical protein
MMTKERDCDIDGYTSKTTNTITLQKSTTYYTIAMRSFHYGDFYAEGLSKQYNLKDNVFEQHKPTRD